MASRRAFLWGLAGVPLLGGEESIASMEQRVFAAINFQRVCADAEPLVWRTALADAARAHSRRMLEARFFGHQDPQLGDLRARLDRAAIAWMNCGENVFREKDYTDLVAIAVVAWMYSPGHRKNLLSPAFTATGVGIATDGAGTVAVTQEFVGMAGVVKGQPRE